MMRGAVTRFALQYSRVLCGTIGDGDGDGDAGAAEAGGPGGSSSETAGGFGAGAGGTVGTAGETIAGVAYGVLSSRGDETGGIAWYGVTGGL